MLAACGVLIAAWPAGIARAQQPPPGPPSSPPAPGTAPPYAPRPSQPAPSPSTYPGATDQQYWPGQPGQPQGPQQNVQQRSDAENPRLRFRQPTDPYAGDGTRAPAPRPTMFESASSPGTASRVQ